MNKEEFEEKGLGRVSWGGGTGQEKISYQNWQRESSSRHKKKKANTTKDVQRNSPHTGGQKKGTPEKMY